MNGELRDKEVAKKMAGKQSRAKAQRQRVPFGQQRRKLEVLWADPDDAKRFVSRWISDKADRLVLAQRGGYEFVNPKEVIGLGDPDVDSGNQSTDSRISRYAGLDANNRPVKMYLMRIPREFYEEDQALKEESNLNVDRQIKDGAAGGANVEGAYGKVKIRTEVGHGQAPE